MEKIDWLARAKAEYAAADVDRYIPIKYRMLHAKMAEICIAMHNAERGGNMAPVDDDPTEIEPILCGVVVQKMFDIFSYWRGAPGGWPRAQDWLKEYCEIRNIPVRL